MLAVEPPLIVPAPALALTLAPPVPPWLVLPPLLSLEQASCKLTIPTEKAPSDSQRLPLLMASA
jgi:hypothetical protein